MNASQVAARLLEDDEPVRQEILRGKDTLFMVVLYSERESSIMVVEHNLNFDQLHTVMDHYQQKGLPAYQHQQTEAHDDDVDPGDCKQCAHEIGRCHV